MKKRTLTRAWILGLALGAALTVVGAASAAGTAPANTAPPTLSGATRAGETMTASPGTWSGTQPITYAYQWQSCDKNGANCNPISGATTSSYAIASSDVGNTLRVRVTASNSAGSSSATSVPSAVISERAVAGLSLQANHALILYGRTVTISGMAAGAAPDTQVTIRGYHPGTANKIFPVGITSTRADGSFSLTFQPSQRTVFIAKIGSQTSAPVTVNVRPKVVVHHLAGSRLRVNVLAARPLVGRYVLIQRYSRARHVWVSVERVYLNTSTTASGTVVSTGLTHLRLGGVMTRVFVPLGQARPGYASSTSGAFTL